ncbi:MAG: DinB family protein [Candidatus Latescibacteria bacterium]|nr:DinB family protein [Candidatus Latescibacterota bacterium]
MDKAQVGGQWDHFRTIHGITMRAIQAIPKDKVDAKPVKDMRTPKELVAHMYSSMRSITEGTAKGEIQWSEENDKAEAAKLKTHDDLVRYASEAWKAADKAVRSLSDAQIAATVKTPWGESFPGHVCVNIIYDEHLHHRGQLYAYLRQMGVEPPFMWDFEHNATEFQPKAAQKV